MLTRNAQPTNRTRPRKLCAAAPRFSAALGACLATFAILISLASPAGSAAATAGSGAWPWPLVGDVVTPYRNGSDRYAAGQHRGLDIAAPAGSPVRAIVGGRVTFSGKLPDGGQTVTVRTSDGAYLISFLHLASRAVARGASVEAGVVIGASGTTGKRSIEQPHLHLSVRRASDRAYLDPMTLLGAPRLPEAPVASPAPTVLAKPSQVAKPAHAHVTPLERGGRAHSNVHARSNGDISPAHRHGASGRSATGTNRSAGASAREGHAASQFSRVAPPPLSRPVVTKALPAPTPVAEPSIAAESVAKRSTPAGPNRWLFLAVAFVCLVALMMRRNVRPAPRRGRPSAPADLQSGGDAPTAEVIPLHRAS
jgi:hypothetical protein